MGYLLPLESPDVRAQQEQGGNKTLQAHVVASAATCLLILQFFL